jgi:hypothetical protein
VNDPARTAEYHAKVQALRAERDAVPPTVDVPDPEPTAETDTDRHGEWIKDEERYEDGCREDRPHDEPVVTDAQAELLAMHAIHVQGGFSTPERERERALEDLRRGGPIDFDRIAAEVDEALSRQMEADALLRAGRAGGSPGYTEVRAAQVPAEDAERLTAGEAPEVVFSTTESEAQLDIAKIRRYRELREAEAAADAEKGAIKEEADALETELVEAFSEAGLQNLSVDGKTVYLHRSTYALKQPGVTADDIKTALIESGNADLVTETVNAQTLNAFVRELLDSDDAKGLPPELASLLSLGERYGVRITTSTSPNRKKSTAKKETTRG